LNSLIFKRVKTKTTLSYNNFDKYLFLLIAVGPVLAGYILFGLFPNILTLFYSFTRWDGISPKIFVGLENYINILKDINMWTSLYHNLIILIFVPVVTIIFSLFLAYALVNKGFKENKFYKVLFFFPNILPAIVITLLWSFIYDGEFGLLNAVLKLIGIDMQSFYWLADEKIAIFAVMVPMIWVQTGFYVVIFANAMMSIPKSLYELARLEGASHFKQMFQITIPLIWGVIKVAIIFTAVGTIKSFEYIFMLTNGGPYDSTNVIGLYMFNMAFARNISHQYGYASAVGMFLFVVLVGINYIIDRLFSKEQSQF